MPGIRGLGCRQCRQQKKKCDCIQPSCSRCTRLGIVCDGSGQRKFQFLGAKHFQRGRHAKSSEAPNSDALEMSLVLSNEQDMLLNAFCETIKPSTQRRYNLVSAYGPLLYEIPRRLGTNEALDSALRALISAHSDICTRSRVSSLSVMRYNQSVECLRVSLYDSVKARSPESICAAMVLLMCQVFSTVTWSSRLMLITTSDIEWLPR